MIRLTNQLLQATPAARIATPDGAGAVAPVTATGAVIQAVSTNGTQEVTVTRLQSQPLSSASLSSATVGTEGLMSPLDFSGGCVRPGSGLLSWWQGEWDACDFLNNNPGNLVAWFDEGMVGTAFSFDGSSQSVQVPYLTSPACLATPSFTIECWVCPLAQSAGQAFIFGQAYGRQLVVTPGGEAGMWVSLYVADLGGIFHGTVSPGEIFVDQWTHLAGTYDGTDLKLYINGALVAQIAPELPAILDSACPFSIGGINDACGYSGQYFCGLIDEVSVYDRALFHGEIEAIYQAGSEGKCKTQASCAACPGSAVAWWPGEGNASDALGNHAGTAQNGAGYDGGMTGQAFSFDGVNQAVEIAHDSSFFATPAFSVEAWVNPSGQVDQAFIFGQSYGRQLIVRSGNRGLSAAFVVATSRLAFYEVDSTGEIPLGQWTHLVGTWDGASTLSLYINGALDQTATLGVVPWDSGCPFHIGGIYNPAGGCAYQGQFFPGLIDETAYYIQALAATDVQALYNAGSAGKCPVWPNITFSLSVPSLYVNFNPVPVQVNVSEGVPVSMAVLLDSADFDHASWTSFDPNLAVDLGSSQGWHYVWVGLRASAGSEPTWERVRLMLDYTAPALVITNPVVLVGSQPLLQAQGYCIEPLASLSCDLNNSAGQAPDQMALVLDQFYDTNTWAFTTNYFQVFDLVLTNGANAITLHATDLAGNASTTTLDYVLTSDTAPPLITLGWPQEAQKLSGENFTVDGWLDDPSALVQISLVDSSGVTNTSDGVVERDGRFWVENLPLADGASSVSLTATDAWGNSATTNITIHRSDLELAVSPIDPNLLFQPTVSLDGTVSDPTCTIWVNGRSAVNNGDGTWHADSVPFNAGGTASFAVTAYPAGHDLEASAASIQKPNVDLPDRLYVASDVQYAISDYESYVATYESGNLVDWASRAFDRQYGHSWMDGVGGGGGGYSQYFASSSVREDSGQCGVSLSWPPSSWPDFSPGTEIRVGDYLDSDLWDFMEVLGTDASPIIGQEHCHVSDPQGTSYSYEDGTYYVEGWDRVNYSRSAQTRMKLFTGGKAIPGRRTLFSISAWAKELLGQRFTPPYSVLAEPFFNLLPSQRVSLGELGALGSDGRLYRALPDRTTVEVTPFVPDKEHYWFDVTAQKHKLHIVANEAPLAEDRIAPLARFTVGQRIGLYPNFTPSLPEEPQKTVKWTLDPQFINSFTVWVLDPEIPPGPSFQAVLPRDESYYDQAWGLTAFAVDSSRLQQEHTFAWWLTGSETSYGRKEIYVAMLLTFSNGQGVSIARKGLIGMHKPTVAWDAVQYQPGVPQGSNPQPGFLTVSCMGFEFSANSTSIGHDGSFGMTQLLTRQSSMESWADWRLDAELPYDTPSGYGGLHPPYVASYHSGDNPSVPDSLLNGHAYCTDAFKQYFMYRRSTPGSIWVTLGVSTWNWHGNVQYDPTPPDFWSWVDTPSFQSSQAIQPSSELPQWTNRKIDGSGS